MATIAPELQQQIEQAPQNEYAVIITLKGGQLPPTLANKGNFIMGDEIFSARLKGEEIENLADHQQVIAIENDMEMGIL